MTVIAVLGAGVVGLSTALNIQKLLPNVRVRIIADKYSRETTSYGAGGIFLPTTEEIPGVPEEILKQWCRASWEFYSSLALSAHAVETGHEVAHGYVPCKNKKEKDPIYKDIVFNYKELSQAEIQKLQFTDYRYCYQVTTIITTVSIYLPWLTRRFKENGGDMEYKTIQNINELVGQYDLVVNCTGFGSKRLFNDNKITPVRGQLLRVHAPWIKTWLYPDDGSYILPNRHLVVLGGIRQADNENKTVDLNDSQTIRENCLRLCPALEGYKLDHEWVGLRPSRTSVRLEKENVILQNGNLKLVHNYGHGANGIALSWGTGLQAAKLVKEMLYDSHESKL